MLKSSKQYIKENVGHGFIHINGKYPYVAELNNILISGNKGIAYCFTTEGDLLADSVLHPRMLETCIKEYGFSIDSIKEMKGSYLSLVGVWATRFYHWVMEYLPRILIAQKAGFKGNYIIPEGVKFIDQTLNLIGIDKTKLVYYDGKTWLIEKLYLPEVVTPEKELKKFPQLINDLRNSFIPKPTKERGRRILLNRKQNLRKVRIVNEKELIELLSYYNFENIYMEDFNFADQVKIASESNCLIAQHGAGMVHTLFMQKNSLIIELFSPYYIPPSMLPAIEILGHDYHMVTGPFTYFTPYNYGENIYAFLDVIEVILKKHLS